jgi:hypothetical protein
LVSVDKPPLGFLIQALSAAILGFRGWSLILPQALAGVLAIPLLFHLVRRVFGVEAGLLAALVLAITRKLQGTLALSRTRTMSLSRTLTLTLSLSRTLSRTLSLSLSLMLILAACVLPIPTPQIDHSTAQPYIISPSPAVAHTAYVASATPLPAEPQPTTPSLSPTERFATPTPSLPLTQYDLHVSFDYFLHTLAVTETISYTNQTGVALPDLLLVVRPVRWGGDFALTSLAWADGTLIQDYEQDDYLFRIPLSQPLEAGGRIGLFLTYVLSLPEILPPELAPRPLPYGYTARQTNLVDWYPYLPPYRPGEGWLAQDPGYFGEYLVYDVADYLVEIHLAQPVPDLVIAGSAVPVQAGESYSFTLQAARAFAWSASQQYQALTQMVDGVTVYSYYFPYNADGGQAALDATVQALALYGELFGPYLRPSLSVVEADFLDGMEYSGLYFLSRGFYDLYDGSQRGYLTAIAAHETAHQWWFDLVGNDQALEPWLDEALCTYMERLFYERMDAENPSGAGQSFVDWWWYFRVDYYEPEGWVNGTIYDYDSFRSYRDAVYLRGARFLEAMRMQIGDEAFFGFLRDYAGQMSYRQATANDFFAILAAYASGDLNDLTDRFFENR